MSSGKVEAFQLFPSLLSELHLKLNPEKVRTDTSSVKIESRLWLTPTLPIERIR